MAPACPRCGYDQTGAMAAWERASPPACPLQGLCTECGLRFEWSLLLNPRRAAQQRTFEHAQSRLLAAFARTWWLALKPWALWRTVRMEMRIVPPRLAALALAGGLLSGIIGAIAAAVSDPLYGFASARIGRIVRPMSNPVWSDTFHFRRTTEWHLEGLARPDHWRAVFLLFVLLVPLAFFLLRTTLARTAVRPAHLARAWAYGLVSLPLALAASQVLETLLGLLHLAEVLVHPRRPWMSGIGVWLYTHPAASGLGTLLAWSFAWWGLAASRYLRLPHPWAVAAGMVILALLIAVGLVALTPGGAVRLMDVW